MLDAEKNALILKARHEREKFTDLMEHNDFIIHKDQVVCGVCQNDCGQCGAGVHQGWCQSYYDNHRGTFGTAQYLRQRRPLTPQAETKPTVITPKRLFWLFFALGCVLGLIWSFKNGL